VLAAAKFTDFVELAGKAAWPVAVVLLLVVLVRSKAGSAFLSGLGGRINSVKGFGVELNLEPDNAKQVKVDLEGQFAEYRTEIRKRFEALNYQYDVVRLRDRLVEKVLLPLRASDWPPTSRTAVERVAVAVRGHLEKREAVSIRCTIYVPDIVFADALYSLTNYYPGGGGAGGVYSIRFGIIGRQWRLGESTYDPEVLSDDHERDQRKLMGLWGMTREQANTKSADRSFLVVMLQHEGIEQGLLLVSSEQDHAFGDDLSIWKQVAAHECTQQLARQVALVNGQMRGRGPALKLFDV
jgi:hypothetical protein